VREALRVTLVWARQSLERILLQPFVNCAVKSHISIYIAQKINHATIVGRSVMAAEYVLADVATKVAYFSLTAVAFVFVSMLLLTGLHP
jgi:hypothetical protein